MLRFLEDNKFVGGGSMSVRLRNILKHGMRSAIIVRNVSTTLALCKRSVAIFSRSATFRDDGKTIMQFIKFYLRDFVCNFE